MNDIVKFCDKKTCEKSILYNKLATAGNNPNISSKMRCSQQIQNYSRSRSSVNSDSKICKTINYNIQNGISNCPPSVLAMISNPISGPNYITTTKNGTNVTKLSAFPCNNPIFRGQNVYSSRNVSVCKCLAFS
jgi:hypothetical protein